MVKCQACEKEAVIISGENNLCEDCYEKKKQEAKFQRDKHILEVAPRLIGNPDDPVDMELSRNTAIIAAGISPTNYDKIVAQKGPNKAYELIWEKDLDNYEAEEKDWIIQDFIPSCSVGVWTGKRGTMKTFLVLNAISCISAGLPFLGKYPTKKGKIIYLDKENGVQIMKQRMPIIKNGLDINGPLDIGFICFSTLKIDKLKDITEIEKVILEHKPSILIVDTYRRGISFEENDAGSVSKLFVDILRPLVEKYKISIVLIHHDRKGESNGDEMDMIRGSSDLANYCDFILKNERKGKHLILKQLKMRSAPEKNPIEINIETDDNTYLSFISVGDYSPSNKEQKAAEILMVWFAKDKIKEFRTKDAKEVAFAAGVKKMNFFNGLQTLIDNGIIEKGGKGDYKVIVDNMKLIV